MSWTLALALAASLLEQGRLKPAEPLACSRDQLTSFTGRVTFYRRTPVELRLTLATDEATVEKFKLRFKRGDDAARWFLFAASKFEPQHWSEIERAPGQLKAGARATVWVCEGGAQPVIDWEAPRR